MGSLGLFCSGVGLLFYNQLWASDLAFLPSTNGTSHKVGTHSPSVSGDWPVLAQELGMAGTTYDPWTQEGVITVSTLSLSHIPAQAVKIPWAATCLTCTHS